MKNSTLFGSFVARFVSPTALYTVGGGIISLMLCAGLAVQVSAQIVPDISFEPEDFTVREGDDSFDVDLDFSEALSTDITIQYTVGGTAGSGDFSIANSGSVAVPASVNAPSASITIEITDDSVIEDDETVILTLQDGTGYNVFDGLHVLTITIEDNEPTISFEKAKSSLVEGDETVMLTVLLEPAPSTDMEIDYSIIGTATEGQDFTDETEGSVEVAAGNPAAFIMLSIMDDTIPEGPETVIVRLARDPSYMFGEHRAHTLTIIDSSPTVSITTRYTKPELEGTPVDFDVTLTPAPTRDVTVKLTLKDSAGDFLYDKDEGDTTLTFYALSGGASDKDLLPIDTKYDDIYEENGEITMSIKRSGDYHVNRSASSASVEFYSEQEPTPIVSFATASSTIVKEPESQYGLGYDAPGLGPGSRTLTLRVNVAPAPTQEMPIFYDLVYDGIAENDRAGGNDIKLTGNLSSRGIPAGQTHVTIPIVDVFSDNLVESDEKVIISLTAGDAYRVAARGKHTLTIKDDEPSATFASASSTADEDAGKVEIMVQFDLQAPSPVMGQVDCPPNTDPFGDAQMNPAYTGVHGGYYMDCFYIPYTLSGTAVHMEDFTIVDDVDFPGEGDISDNFEQDPDRAYVAVRAMQGGMFRGNIEVLIADDADLEQDETLILTLEGGLEHPANGFYVGRHDVHTLTIRANDGGTPTPPTTPPTTPTTPTTPATPTTPPTTPNAPTVTLSASPNPVAEGDSVMITIRPSQLFVSDVTVPLVLTAGTAEAGDYSALASIVIEGNEPNGSGMIGTLLDEDLDDETFTVSLGALPSGVLEGTPASVVVTIIDSVGGVDVVSSEADGQEIPDAFALGQNYPNPFNPSTAIEFALPEAAYVLLEVFDAIGRSAGLLVDGMRPAGTHTVRFDAKDLPSGLYVYRLQAGGEAQTKTMLLAR